MKLPDWKIIRYDGLNDQFLCSDGEIRTSEQMIQMEQNYFNAYLNDLITKDVIIPNKEHYNGIEFRWKFDTNSQSPD